MSNQDEDTEPNVSVIIPVYDRAELVLRAIDSVLAQTYGNLELILVDDGSTDDLAGSLSRISDKRLRLVSHGENKGAAAARNTGVLEAEGRYIAFLDSDDYWLPEKLERQLEFMRTSDKKTRMCCTAYKILSRYHPEGELRFGIPTMSKKDMQWGCSVSPGTTLFAERSIFREAGPMNERMSRLEDWDWLLRCLKLTKLETLNEVLSVVDYSSVRTVEYEAVRSSVAMMRPVHFITQGLLPSLSRLKFLAALENELAVAAYRNGRYGLAIRHMLKSLCFMPYRNFESIKRIGFGFRHDLFHKNPGQ